MTNDEAAVLQHCPESLPPKDYVSYLRCLKHLNSLLHDVTIMLGKPVYNHRSELLSVNGTPYLEVSLSIKEEDSLRVFSCLRYRICGVAVPDWVMDIQRDNGSIVVSNVVGTVDHPTQDSARRITSILLSQQPQPESAKMHSIRRNSPLGSYRMRQVDSARLLGKSLYYEVFYKGSVTPEIVPMREGQLIGDDLPADSWIEFSAYPSPSYRLVENKQVN